MIVLLSGTDRLFYNNATGATGPYQFWPGQNLELPSMINSKNRRLLVVQRLGSGYYECTLLAHWAQPLTLATIQR